MHKYSPSLNQDLVELPARCKYTLLVYVSTSIVRLKTAVFAQSHWWLNINQIGWRPSVNISFQVSDYQMDWGLGFDWAILKLDMHGTILEILLFNPNSYCTSKSSAIWTLSSQFMCSNYTVRLSGHNLSAHTVRVHVQ